MNPEVGTFFTPITPSLAIGIGIVAGLVVQVIVYFVRRGWLPFLNLFNENSIAGTWTSEYKEGNEVYRETVTVRQIWHSITATAILTEEGKQTEIQEIKGTYKNQILTAEYWSTKKNVIERGTFTLSRADAETLEGFFTFFAGKPLKLQQSAYVWKASR